MYFVAYSHMAIYSMIKKEKEIATVFVSSV